ncbi:MAG: hypothetical protein EPN91_07940 [Salinibacterium sp.]|nr:MAG: hypothetical protein EPN91_07940 [Salinibacterium sp.]
MIERFTRLRAPLPRPLRPTERLRLRGFELAWTTAWAIAGASFIGSLGPFVCGLLCMWGLFEVERWVEAGRG